MSSPVQVKDLSQDARWALANRIVNSSGFAKAAQLRELLLYLCRCAIVDPSAEVTEQEIGSRVLGRRPDYDTQADNIVRVQIRHLRQKLEEYFAGEGAHEYTLLMIPKGGRVAHFEPRPIPMPAPVPETPLPPPRKRYMGATLAVLGLAAGTFFVGRLSVPNNRLAAATSDFGVNNRLWMQIFDKDQPTTLVISDSSLAFAQDMLRSNLSLDDMSKGKLKSLIDGVADERMREALREVTVRQYTSMADATLASRIATSANAMGARVAVRYSRHMGIRDFNTGNFVIVGSRRGIPWVELLEPDLNFHLQAMGSTRQFGFQNKAPESGEAATYSTIVSEDGRYETYAVISFLPNPKHTGDVLLLEGIMMEGTEAAGEFAMSQEFATQLDRKMGTTPKGKMPPFEVLLKIQAVSGSANRVDVVAWRRPNVR